MTKAYTSRVLRGIAYLWTAFPAAYLLYAAVALGVNMAGLVKLILSPWYWFVGFVAVMAGQGILKIHWYGWYAFLFSNFTIAYQTAVALAHYSDGEFKTTVFFLTALFQVLAIFIVAREIRVPYFFPRIRWWESDPRYKLSVPVKLSREDKVDIEGEILDLSMGGCFIKTHSYFVPDELLRVDFSVFERGVKCSGRVVWKTESTVTHPKGIGVKFETLTKDNVFCLKQATQKAKKLARVASQKTRERNWEEYLQREQRYQGKAKK